MLDSAPMTGAQQTNGRACCLAPLPPLALVALSWWLWGWYVPVLAMTGCSLWLLLLAYGKR